jgi:ABC-type branched-subunit amino acid transport system permease subunit
MTTVSRLRPALLALGAMMVLAAGSVLGEYPRYVVALWLVYSLSAVGLNLTLGWGAIAITRWGWPIPLAIVFSAVVAALAGVLVGLPAIRLRQFSLAIVTFAFGTTLFQVVKSFAYTGGPNGLFLTSLPLDRSPSGLSFFLAIVLLALLGLVAYLRVVESKTGRALAMIAANETAARSFGIDVTAHKLAAFAFSAVLGAVAGGLHALLTGYVSPDTYSADLSILLFAAVMIGGKGLALGPFLGAAFVVAVPELTQEARTLAQVVYGALLLLVVTLLPDGLLSLFHRRRRAAEPPAPVGAPEVTSSAGTP